MYSAEVFPLINREVGMSLACAVNFALAGVLALTIPQLSHSLGQPRLLGLFAGLDAAAAILVWLFLPSTVQIATLEEMNVGRPFYGSSHGITNKHSTSSVSPQAGMCSIRSRQCSLG